MTDYEVIHAIQILGGRDAEKAATYLLKEHIKMAYQMQHRYKLDTEASKDLFADAISSVIWDIHSKKFKGESKISTYLFRVLNNRTVDFIRHLSTNKNKQHQQSTWEVDIDQQWSITDSTENSLDAALIKDEIIAMGQPCQDILIDWAYWGYSMTEIANRNGLKDASAAKRKKYNCLKKIRETLANKNIQ